jgi:release factor glutamine methyltransferase
MMSAKRALRIRAWHDAALSESNREKAIELNYLGTSLLVPPGVFVPTPVSPLLGKAVLAEVNRNDRVLDLGTGSGVNAILAASKTRNVVAVDINPASIICAKRNAKRNAVQSHIAFVESDLFDNVSGRFDVIIFDPPFRWFKPRSMQERATADEDYITLTAFFKHAKSRLRPGGRILLFFGTSGDINYLRHAQAGLRKRIVASKEIRKDDLKVKYLTYKLT